MSLLIGKWHDPRDCIVMRDVIYAARAARFLFLVQSIRFIPLVALSLA